MRIIIITLIFFLTGISCQKKTNYIISGNISGNVEGKKVLLKKMESPNLQLIDSTFIKDGVFIFKGTLDEPTFCTIQIDKTKEGEPFSLENLTNSRFYLENSDITFSGEIDYLPTVYWSDMPQKEAVITGSISQKLYQDYLALGRDLKRKISELHNEYLKEYHIPTLSGIFNTSKGIEISQKKQRLEEQLADVEWKFIMNNIQSVVGYDLAKQYFQRMYVPLSIKQIVELEERIDQIWENTKKPMEFKKIAEKGKKVAIGAQYPDVNLINTEGEQVKLSEYVNKGKYVMLEFWASWCGPCRGEIPHLKNIYQEYKDKGFEIISISIDQDDKAWGKAIKEENMEWTQLNAPGEFNSSVAQIYKISGVPYCILLDKEGKIFQTDMRGARLDGILEEIYLK